MHPVPLSLYIHLPWCIKKCPYCDFNSHTLDGHTHGLLPEQLASNYVQALLADARAQTHWAYGRTIDSIFIGGGTPSLLPPAHYAHLLAELAKLYRFASDIEITMEANSGTLEYAPLENYRSAGINRLSIGVQSFNDTHLQALGRIHSSSEAAKSIAAAHKAGFAHINVDLMHGLPKQTLEQAIFDLQNAIDLGATHISWYQLTIEPNTVFYRSKPQLPNENTLERIQQQGEELLKQHGFTQYEVSAWYKGEPCRHNLNYWQFGDYLAIGAGGHGKITHIKADGSLHIERYQKTRLPGDYLKHTPAAAIGQTQVTPQELPFEYMLNTLRLMAGTPIANFNRFTGLNYIAIQPIVDDLVAAKLLYPATEHLQCTQLGMRYLNSVVAKFAP